MSKHPVIKATGKSSLWLTRKLARYFLTGDPLYGPPRDNASFRYAATEDFRGKPVEKLSGPLWHRLARRWLLLGVPAVMFLVLAPLAIIERQLNPPAPWWTELPWPRLALAWHLLAVISMLGYLAYRSSRHLVRRRSLKDFVYPAAEAACRALGRPYHRRHAAGMISLPHHYEPEQDQVIEPRLPFYCRWLQPLPAFMVERLLAQVMLKRQVSFELAEIEAEAAGKTIEPTSVERRRWRKRSHDPLTEQTDPEPVRVNLKPGDCRLDSAKKALRDAVGNALGMTDPKAEWHLRGPRPHVMIRPSLPPPPAVTFAQVKRHYDKASLERPVVGLAPGNRPVHSDYANNSPHVLVSGGSGTGKSVFFKGLFCQRMHYGAGLIVLDYKRVSHRWAHMLPGCIYAWKIADIHNVMIAVGQELERRLEEVIDPNDPTGPEREFPTIDILVEEINSLTPMLQAYWAEVRQAGQPMQSPAILAFRNVVNMGRQLRMHEHIAAQRASANVFGANGGDVRENFQERFIARWTKQLWAILANGLPYQRCPGNAGRGVWAHIEDDKAEIFRAPWLTDAEAIAYATSGVPCPPTPFGGPLTGAETTEVEPARKTEIVTLRDALPLLPGEAMTLDALQKAAQRKGFPAVIGTGERKAKLYSLQSLIDWRGEQIGAELEAAYAMPAADARHGIVYRFWVRPVDRATGMPIEGPPMLGYIGQTRQKLSAREDQHRGEQPWSDLIVGMAEVLYEGVWTDAELTALEDMAIKTLRPVYNFRGQEGAEHAIPKYTAKDHRWARDARFRPGQPRWEPEDRYRPSYAR